MIDYGNRIKHQKWTNSKSEIAIYWNDPPPLTLGILSCINKIINKLPHDLVYLASAVICYKIQCTKSRLDCTANPVVLKTGLLTDCLYEKVWHDM
jgi:hypothetical protein